MKHTCTIGLCADIAGDPSFLGGLANAPGVHVTFTESRDESSHPRIQPYLDQSPKGARSFRQSNLFWGGPTRNQRPLTRQGRGTKRKAWQTNKERAKLRRRRRSEKKGRKPTRSRHCFWSHMGYLGIGLCDLHQDASCMGRRLFLVGIASTDGYVSAVADQRFVQLKGVIRSDDKESFLLDRSLRQTGFAPGYMDMAWGIVKGRRDSLMAAYAFW
jgi:hypothetical protein